jgi:cyclomaltodextrinase / maltogenic alpha-amylase / neopullulanase
MQWAPDAVLYHLYPLGALGAPPRNDFSSAPGSRLEALHAWLDDVEDLGATAVQLGPIWESTTHGYDTADYFAVDRRLGDDAALSRWSDALHRRGLRLVLDGVFHHAGRDFWAFRDVQALGEASPYRDWFFLDFSGRSPFSDPFSYQGWQGHYDLVKLNTGNPAVRDHLFAAVHHWVEAFGVDGLRLDAANVLDLDFQRDLADFCRSLRSDFWLFGEVVHGDYRRWANPATLDAVTNYELYKALFSSHNDRNYFELAHALGRQSDEERGLYRDLALATFADNHDVDRLASRLNDPAHLYPLYALLLTAPGVPSIYYGSEWGIDGRKAPGSDAPLRPALDPAALRRRAPHRPLREALRRLIRLRRTHPALRHGSYRQLHVAREQLAFLRATDEERVLVAVNAAGRGVDLRLTLPGESSGRLIDLLDGSDPIPFKDGVVAIRLYRRWARVLHIEGDR